MPQIKYFYNWAEESRAEESQKISIWAEESRAEMVLGRGVPEPYNQGENVLGAKRLGEEMVWGRNGCWYFRDLPFLDPYTFAT